MKIGLVQNNILWEDKNFNLHMSKDFFKQAKRHNVDLLLFPEMSFTGFTMNINRCGEANSHSINYIKSLCKSFGINAGMGYIEKNSTDEKGKNNYTIISSQGHILCDYTKIHPFSYSNEDLYFTPGDHISYCNINDFTITPFICYDLRFPEIFQIASKKSSLIIVVANWPESRKEHWITLLKARAIENQCYIAGINRVGIGNSLNYSGNSMIIDPLGNIISKELDNFEGLILGDIYIDDVKRVRYNFNFKNDRNEDFYCKNFNINY